MSKIRIKNFGPIKEGYLEDDGWLDVKKVTVFIGNQGSGKSTVAKLISTLTWIEKALVRGDLTEKYVSSYNRFVKYYCAYQNIHNYFKKDTEIHYQGNSYALIYQKNKFIVTSTIRFDEPFNIGSFINIPASEAYHLPKIMYVPAERNFASASEGAGAVKGLPKTLYTFTDEFDNAIQDIKGSLSIPLNNVKFEYQKLNKISYIIGDNYKVRLSESSSGFQSFVPLYIVSRHLAASINQEGDRTKKELSIDEEKRIKKEIEAILSNPNLSEEVRKASLEYLTSRYKASCFINIVEEPEQNLFPSSQQKMLNSLLEFNNMNEGNKLIMTTHSPYLINYLTLAVKAETVKNNLTTTASKDKLNKIVPLQSTLDGKDLIIYEFNEEDGAIKVLPDYKGLPSDENYLNSSLEDSNELFAQLQEIEKGWR
jgi:predicted ATPase